MEKVRITMEAVFGAASALEGLMKVRGMPAAVQLALVRLWRQLDGERQNFALCERAAVEAHGGVIEADAGSGKSRISFSVESQKAAYLEEIRELLGAEVELEPEEIDSCAGLWTVISPMELYRLEGLLHIREGA